jgi:chromosome segregation protein
MKISFVELCGFRGFKEKVRFDLPNGFVVLNGRNGSGKSTILDAIDFAISGTINKFSTRNARGGGLDEHIWWVGRGKPEAHYVKVGFVDETDTAFEVTYTRDGGSDRTPEEIAGYFCQAGGTVAPATIIQTTLIRDETIASLSLDLPEQARFEAVRIAIGGVLGPNYSARMKTIVDTTDKVKATQQSRVEQEQGELGRTLGELTEARSAAERSSNVAEALQLLDRLDVALPETLAARVEAVRTLLIEKRTAFQRLEAARRRSVAVQAELAFFRSDSGEEEVKAAEVAVAEAQRLSALAQDRLRASIQSDTIIRDSDDFAVHMTALLQHGTALGLQDGHCPLCNAANSPEEFEQAIAATRARLATIGERLKASAQVVVEARSAASAAADDLTIREQRLQELVSRKDRLEAELAAVAEIYDALGLTAPAEAPEQAENLLLRERQVLVRLERALLILESSSAVDRMRSLEARVASLRQSLEQEIAQLTAAEKASEAARQIETSARTVANEILEEQFDTVMPLLKELYRRLRPHSEWKDIQVEFRGRVRASLNFSVEGGMNPQFLFSSGQRRAAGLAFLLATHLSRQWCRWQSLLLDDPVQHIDDYRALNLVEVLAAIRRSDRQVIVAVEDPALADVLCRRLRPSLDDFGRRFDLRTSKTGAAEITGMQDIHPLPREVFRFAQVS